jgi:hypothetical protein
MKSSDQVLLEEAYNRVMDKAYKTIVKEKSEPQRIGFESLPKEAQEDAMVQEYDKGYDFILKQLTGNEIENILDEKGIGEEDKTLWRSTKHYRNLKRDIEKNGFQVPALGYEGVHRMLIALELGLLLPYYEPVIKS